MAASDDDLATRLRRGDRGAFDALFDRFAGPLRAFLAGMLGDREAAADLVQETFLRVHRHVARYEERGTFRAWVYRIAHNLALTELRRRRYRESPVGDVRRLEVSDGARGDPAMIRARRERARAVESALGALPEAQRAVVLLRVRDGLPLEEIAHALGVPVGTVKSRLHHAVKHLRETVGRTGPAPRGEAFHDELR